MALDHTNLYPDSSGNGGYTKSWNYTTLDSIATVTAAGYFNKVASRLAIGDNIFVSVVDRFESRTRTTLIDHSTLYVSGISGGVVTAVATTTLPLTDCLAFVIDGAGNALTTGLKGYVEVPFNATITVGTLLADRVGSVAVDIYKCTYAQFDPGVTHPVAGDTITAAAPLTIASASKMQDSTLTGWTRTLAAGDILAFNINSATTIQRVTVSLKMTHT